MYRFFQTWNIPGSCQFEYIAFYANSRKEAAKIAAPWIDSLAENCQLTSDIANGCAGSLVSCTEAKKGWHYQSGKPILNWESGEETYYFFCESAGVKSLG